MAASQRDLFSPDDLYEMLEGTRMDSSDGKAVLPPLTEIVRWMDVISKLIFTATRHPTYLKNHPEAEAELAELSQVLDKAYKIYEEEVHHMTNTLFCWDADLRRGSV